MSADTKEGGEMDAEQEDDRVMSAIPLGQALVELHDGASCVAFSVRIPQCPIKAAKKLRVMLAILKEDAGWASH